MKRKYILLLSGIFSIFAINVHSKNPQKPSYGFIEMQKLMQEVPEYTLAERRFRNAAEKEQKKISEKYNEYKTTMQIIQKSDTTMSEKARKNLEEKIVKLQTEIESLQRNYEPNLLNLRNKYLKPIMDDLAQVASKMCKEFKIDKLERIEDNRYLYLNPEYNYTKNLLNRLKSFYKKKK